MDPTHGVLFQAKLKDLEAVAEKLSIHLEYCDLSNKDVPIRSGHCKVGGQDRIYLDNNLSASSQIEVLLEILKKFNLETIYVSAWIREQLEQDWNNKQ